MGRLATSLAAVVANADNLPAKIPNISVIDALLPDKAANWLGPEKAISPPSDRKSVAYSEVTRDRKGRMMLVNHKRRVTIDGTYSASRTGLKQENERGSKVEQPESKNEAGGSNKNSGALFTPEEDAKLKELKACNTSWKEIVVQMSRPRHELKARWDEIDPTKSRPGDGVNEGVAHDNTKKKNEEPFSPDEDTKLQELKASNPPWKEISEQMDRPVEVLKARYKEIGPKAEGGGGNDHTKKDDMKHNNSKDRQTATGGKKDKQEKGGKAKKGVNKEQGQGPDNTVPEAAQDIRPSGEVKNNQIQKANGKKDKIHKANEKPEGKKTKPPAKAPSTAPSEVKFTRSEWSALQEDDVFDFAELCLLSELIMENQNQTWLRVASRFADKTGRRVHPDTIAQKFAEIGG